MRMAPLAAALITAVLVGGCSSDHGADRPTKRQFIALADGICAHLPTRAQLSGSGSGRADLLSAIRRYVDDSERASAELQRLQLPPAPDRRAAKRFVDSVRRVVIALKRLAPAADRYIPADPTNAAAVGRSFHELGSAGALVDRASRASDKAAVGFGFRRCGQLRPIRAPDQTAAPPTLAQRPPAGLSPGARRQFQSGQSVAAQSGCLACHRIGSDGNHGPGPDLSMVGARLSPGAIARVLRDPAAPMPSYRSLPPGKLAALVTFLAAQHRGA